MKFFAISLLFLLIGYGCTTPPVNRDEVNERPGGVVVHSPTQAVTKSVDPTALPAPTTVLKPSQDRGKKLEADSRAKQELSEGTITRFRGVYQNMGNPRIAVYVNRELSDEVREWTGATKFLLGQKESTDAKRKVMALGVDTNEETTRSSPNDAWMWDFENGFMNPFLSAGTQLVDQPTIMRLSALKTQKPGSSFQGARKRTIEMEALLDFADIFVEVLVTRAPSTSLGYEIKAIAKEVRTGVILAHASSTRWSKKKNEAKETKEAVSTPTGYKMVSSKKEEDFPNVAEVSTDLAMEVMNALIRSWG